MAVDLYFIPVSCSLATRIALGEIGEPATFHKVDMGSKTLPDGSDYFAVNPKGKVPALRTREGWLLTEGAAVLQYVADLAPESGLAPAPGTKERYELQQWLNFVATELHKSVFAVLFDPASNDGAKAFAMTVLENRATYLNGYLEGREFLTDRFTVADAYLVTVLNWFPFAGIDRTAWPALEAYYNRISARPSVAAALADEAKAMAA